ncbi:alpha/beta hydrolase [Methylobacterium sp. ID0610]|uniref:alpha/beta hydrolase n=1 Tax=Methylobacterium carpenticola TaxID=3344827 RepID=UPI0036A050FE
MARTIGFTPPALAEASSGPVRRRHVFYVPGYDPESHKRYRALFARELSRYAKRFALWRRISPATASPDGRVQSWTVEAGGDGWETHTTYEVLLWDDLVRQDFRRPLWVTMLLLTAGVLQTTATTQLFRMYRLNWKYGNIILYPFVMTLALVLAAGGIGWFVAGLPTGLGPAANAGLGAVAGFAALAAALAILPHYDHRIFLRQLINDWVFNWQHSNGWRRDYEERLSWFADYAAARGRAVGADEVMIIGHSSGALTAVEVAARLLERTEGSGTALSVLTLGGGLPLVALNPLAQPARAAIARLVESDRVVWADYQAPQDWMNFPGFNPARDLALPPLARIANPLIRSTKFRELLDPAVYAKISFRPFRMHFQFLMSNDRPGEYDFFALTLGPQALRDRVLAPQIVPARGDVAAEPASAHREI